MQIQDHETVAAIRRHIAELESQYTVANAARDYHLSNYDLEEAEDAADESASLAWRIVGLERRLRHLTAQPV